MRQSLNISLPENLRAWILEQVEEGGFSSASEYLRHLLREEQKRQLQSTVDRALLAGLSSGHPQRMNPQAWKELRRDARQRASLRKRQ